MSSCSGTHTSLSGRSYSSLRAECDDLFHSFLLLIYSSLPFLKYDLIGSFSLRFHFALKTSQLQGLSSDS